MSVASKPHASQSTRAFVQPLGPTAYRTTENARVFVPELLSARMK